MRIPFRPYPPMAEADHDGGQQNWKIELKGGGSGTCRGRQDDIAFQPSFLESGKMGRKGIRRGWEEMKRTCVEWFEKYCECLQNMEKRKSV